MQFSLKPATPADIPMLSALAHEIWNEYYTPIIGSDQVSYMLGRFYSTDALLQQMKDGHRFHIILAENKPGGYLSESNSSATEGTLHKFYLAKFLRGNGLGHKVFHSVFDGRKDLKRLRLTVNRMNYNSINFYFSLGFIIEDTIDIDIDNGFYMNDYIMLKIFNVN